MRRLFLLLLLSASSLHCTGCRSLDRLFRNSPLSGAEIDADRINLWPLFYRNGESVAVLWPGYDEDVKGFALRPLLTHDGDHWELLPPLCYWNTKTGDWVFLPAYSLGDSFGLFPIFGSGWLNHAGPFWWDLDHAGKLDAGGLFPLFQIGTDFTHIGPMIWGYKPNGETQYMAVLPFFGYGESDEGGGMILSLIGGRGWDKEGKTTFVNVLGPVFHHSDAPSGSETSVLWPLINVSRSPNHESWRVWPIASQGTLTDTEGNPLSQETTALAGLFRHTSQPTSKTTETTSLRFLPLFSYRAKDGGSETIVDYFTLYGHKDHKGGATGIHIGTPLLFNYRGEERGYRWSSLLGTLRYQSFQDESEFSLLYYLYRQKTRGTETTRDFFPFCSWDTGENRSGFSFLWRLFRYERVGDRVGGHIFFIPWGDSE